MELHYQKEKATIKNIKFFFGLLGVVFHYFKCAITNFFMKVPFSPLLVSNEKYFIGHEIALLSIFIYPIFRRAMPRDKHIMLLVSALGLTEAL